MELIIASSNIGKIEEYKLLFSPYDINIKTLNDINFFEEIDETGTTYIENAIIKARAIYNITGKPVLADDSGTEIDYLNGAPGIYSHRWAGENATNEDRRNKALKELKGVPATERTSHYHCAICFITESGQEYIAEGFLDGVIATEPRVIAGLAYDPIFITSSGKAVSELTLNEKNAISHRGNAFRSLIKILKNEDIIFPRK